MGKFGYNELVTSKFCLQTAADATNIITVGNVKIASVIYATGADINALAADAWTDVVDINLATPFRFQFIETANGTVMLNMAAETVGDYVRVQIEIDAAAVLDFQCGPSKSQYIRALQEGVSATNLPSIPQFAKSRLRLRAYKHGTIDQAGSYLNFPAIYYDEVIL